MFKFDIEIHHRKGINIVYCGMEKRYSIWAS